MAVILILFLLLSGCAQEVDHPPDQDNVPTDIEILSLMFPEKDFTQESKGFRDEEGKLHMVKGMIEGSFVVENNSENLVIIEINEGLSHAEGFYQAYLAVLDESGRNFISPIKNFSSDEGEIALYRGKERTYVLFAGNTTFNGWTSWTGGLWEVGEEWSQKWPEDNGFWEHQAVEINTNGLKVFERKINNTTDQLIPDYEWEYAYRLKWNSNAGLFNKIID